METLFTQHYNSKGLGTRLSIEAILNPTSITPLTLANHINRLALATSSKYMQADGIQYSARHRTKVHTPHASNFGLEVVILRVGV